MRHHPENFEPGDGLLLPLAAEAILDEKRLSKQGVLLTVRVTALRNGNSSNGREVSFEPTRDGVLICKVVLDPKQRIEAVGLSKRRRELLLEQLGGLTADEAELLLREVSESGGENKPTSVSPKELEK